MNAICLVVDRLQAGYLGCYGNRWVQTPELDRLAAESFVFDQAIIDTPELPGLYRAWWYLRHACESATGLAAESSLPGLLAAHDIRMALVTDDAALLASLPAELLECVEVRLVESRPATMPAGDSRQAHLHHVFDAALAWLESGTSPSLLWVHIGSLAQVWDAPHEIRELYRAEDDPESARDVEVPRFVLSANYDPDQLQAVMQAYAAQVTLLDEHVGHFLDCLRDSPLAGDTLIAVLGARAQPLGEHRRVGGYDDALYAELLHVPWLLRFADQRGALCRASELVQPPDLGATLLDYWGITPPGNAAARFARSLLPLVRDEPTKWRDRAVSVNHQGEYAIRTTRWSLRQVATNSISEAASGVAQDSSAARHGHQLFAKPDDRIEVNDVADRCPEVVAHLQQAVQDFVAACARETLAQLRPLDASLEQRHG